MEEIESPVDRLSDEATDAARESRERWLTFSAVLSALFAVLAAITGLQSGHYANEAMRYQIEASDAWTYYQAKGIKAAIAELTPQMQAAVKVQKYHDEQNDIKNDAEMKTKAAEINLNRHEIVARAVTFFQIGIAMTAIAVLMRRRRFLIIAAGLGIIGIIFFTQSMLV